MSVKRKTGSVIGTEIDAISMNDAVARVIDWAGHYHSKIVAICNVHSLVTASRNAAFAEVLNTADIATPDGAPVAWVLRKIGFPYQQRVSGPDLMIELLAACQESGVGVYFFGSTSAVLERLSRNIQQKFPRLRVCGLESPPFADVSSVDEAAVERINSSGAGVVFVGLGCPKQELWMGRHKGRVNAVMLGVGAAFDFHAGTLKRAPIWMQNAGLEWLHRLVSEPRRLAKRYFVTNTVFLMRVSVQLLCRQATKT